MCTALKGNTDMRNILFFFVVSSLLLVPVLSVNSSETLPANSSQNKPPIVAGLIDIKPFGWLGDDGEFKGFQSDVYDLISETIDVKFDKHLDPVSRLIREWNRGELDLIISYNSPQYYRKIDSSVHIACFPILIVSQKGSDIRTLKDLSGKNVGFTTNGYFDRVHAKSLNIKKTTVHNNDMLFQLLDIGRVDAFIMNELIFSNYFLGKNNSTEGKNFNIQSHYQKAKFTEMEIVLSFGSKLKGLPIEKKIKQVVEALKNQGKISEIFNKYGVKDISC